MALCCASLLGCSGGADDAEGGLITQAQYEAAVESARQCMIGKGFTVSPAQAGSLPGMLTFGYETVDEEDSGGAREAFDECYDQHLKLADHDWFFANVPTGEEREGMFVDFAGCIEKESGVTGVAITDSEEQVVSKLLEGTNSDEADPNDKFFDALLCMDQYRYLWPDGMFPE
jgi:hypothetical protein